jgi:hypothetical protein
MPLCIPPGNRVTQLAASVADHVWCIAEIVALLST